MFSKPRKPSLLAGAALAATCLSSPASAAQFLFTFDGTEDVSGTLTTLDVPEAGGGLLITGISGTANGTPITDLLAPGAFASNDNLLFTDLPELLSNGGFSFTAGGLRNNIFRTATLANFALIREADLVSFGNFTVTRVTDPPVGAVPEPGTWALMLLGFGFVGAALRRQRTVRATVRYA